MVDKQRPRYIPAVINITAIATTIIIPPAAGKRILVMQLWLYNAAAQQLILQSSGKLLSGPLTAFPATSAISLPYTGAAHFDLQPGDNFEIVTAAATQVSGFVNYRIEVD